MQASDPIGLPSQSVLGTGRRGICSVPLNSSCPGLPEASSTSCLDPLSCLFRTGLLVSCTLCSDRASQYCLKTGNVRADMSAGGSRRRRQPRLPGSLRELASLQAWASACVCSLFGRAGSQASERIPSNEEQIQLGDLQIQLCDLRQLCDLLQVVQEISK